jgi:hypothetical protein
MGIARALEKHLYFSYPHETQVTFFLSAKFQAKQERKQTLFMFVSAFQRAETPG